MRIAMWSGPRNLSTAMMYSFGARNDFSVWDEPFYAPYLKESKKPHPMLDEIFEREETDPAKVAERCIGEIPNGKKHFYQKHMPHHILETFPQDWVNDVCNVFLIRHPARVIASYSKKNGVPDLADIGIAKQAYMFDRIYAETGQYPITIDSTDIREAPETMLKLLCEAIGIDWDPAMLSWPEGGHISDGAWAPHWYPEVWKSTGFAAAEDELPELPGHLQSVLDQALPYYEHLAQFKIKNQ